MQMQLWQNTRNITTWGCRFNELGLPDTFWCRRCLNFTFTRSFQKSRTKNQTCAKVPKRFEFLGSLSPRSETLMDLGPCTSFLSWDSGNPGTQNCVMPQDPGNPGPQNFDSRKTLETQDLKIWICGETLETQDPEPPNFDASRLKRPWSLHHSM